MQNVVRNHLVGALLAAIAEAEGNEELSRRLHAETKLRLVTMPEGGLWELANVARPPDQPLEEVYSRFRKAVENLRATGEWMKDLETVPRREERNG